MSKYHMNQIRDIHVNNEGKARFSERTAKTSCGRNRSNSRGSNAFSGGAPMTVAPMSLNHFHEARKIDESACCAKCLARFKEVVKECKDAEAKA